MKTGRRHRREFNAVKRRIAMWLTLLTALLTLLLLAYILIISDTVALREYQETEDTPEQLECIPVLSIEDIKKETLEL